MSRIGGSARGTFYIMSQGSRIQGTKLAIVKPQTREIKDGTLIKCHSQLVRKQYESGVFFSSCS